MRRLKQSADILIFVVLIAALGFVWLTGSGTGLVEAENARDEADRAVGALDEALAADRFAGHACEPVLQAVELCSDALLVQWQAGPEFGRIAGPMFYHPSALEDLRNDVDLDIRFFPPKEVTAVADIGEIQLGWAADRSSTVDVAEYIVYRAEKGSPQVVVARLSGADSTWLDTNVQPGVLYTYAVAARTEEALLVRDGKAVTAPSSAVSEYGKRDYEIHPISWDAATGRLRARVRKFHDGAWREKDFTATKGAPIGALDPGSSVDYGTGCILTDVKVAEEATKETIQQVVFDAQGMVVVEQGAAAVRDVERDRIRRIVSIFYKNEVGELERRALVDDGGE